MADAVRLHRPFHVPILIGTLPGDIAVSAVVTARWRRVLGLAVAHRVLRSKPTRTCSRRSTPANACPVGTASSPTPQHIRMSNDKLQGARP